MPARRPPAYSEVLAKANHVSIVADLPARAGIEPCRIGEVHMPDGVIVYLVLAPSLYERRGTPYCGPEGLDWADNDLRFARLSLAAAELAKGDIGLSWVPDLLHVNDWPGGLAPAYLRWDRARVPTILTVHNIAYQGVFGKERMKLLGIPEHAFQVDGVEFHGRISFLKAGMFYADHVSTVSPTYAREITSEALGGGPGSPRASLPRSFVGHHQRHRRELGPGRDPHLPDHFKADNLSGKRAIADSVRTGSAWCNPTRCSA